MRGRGSRTDKVPRAAACDRGRAGRFSRRRWLVEAQALDHAASEIIPGCVRISKVRLVDSEDNARVPHTSRRRWPEAPDGARESTQAHGQKGLRWPVIPALSPARPETPRPACHAGGRGFESRSSGLWKSLQMRFALSAKAAEGEPSSKRAAEFSLPRIKNPCNTGLRSRAIGKAPAHRMRATVSHGVSRDP